MWDLIQKNKNEELNEQERQELEKLFLNDPDEKIYLRIRQGLEKDLTFDEIMYFRMEHQIKELELNRRSGRNQRTDCGN
jgi:hypothetical protein